ncbi:hypothetical protein ES703_46066 [subsurface metagenome]
MVLVIRLDGVFLLTVANAIAKAIVVEAIRVRRRMPRQVVVYNKVSKEVE